MDKFVHILTRDRPHPVPSFSPARPQPVPRGRRSLDPIGCPRPGRGRRSDTPTFPGVLETVDAGT